MGEHHRGLTDQVDRPQASRISAPPEHKHVDTKPERARIEAVVPEVNTNPAAHQAHVKVGPTDRSDSSTIGTPVRPTQPVTPQKPIIPMKQAPVAQPKALQTPTPAPVTPTTASKAPGKIELTDSFAERRIAVTRLMEQLAGEEAEFGADKDAKATWAAEAIVRLHRVATGIQYSAADLSQGRARSVAMEALRAPLANIYHTDPKAKAKNRPKFLGSIGQ